MARKGKCRTCGANYSEKSWREYKDAPNWKDECPACAKRRFHSYIMDYLIKSIGKPGIISIALEYFGDENMDVDTGTNEGEIARQIEKLVIVERFIKNRPRKGGGTPGMAIKAFVEFSEKKVPGFSKELVPREARPIILGTLAVGVGLITIAIIIFFT